MTPLKSFILAQLQQRGPMRDVELWQHTSEPTLTPVTLACLSLEEDGYIEIPRGNRPLSFEWQITEKGREYVAANFSREASAHA
jgi:DNA-binding PadR family transcriptional regulator